MLKGTSNGSMMQSGSHSQTGNSNEIKKLYYMTQTHDNHGITRHVLDSAALTAAANQDALSRKG